MSCCPTAGVARNEEEKPSGTNAKLKAKLEEVRRSVAEAKAQVAAATGLGEARKQVRKAGICPPHRCMLDDIIC